MSIRPAAGRPRPARSGAQRYPKSPKPSFNVRDPEFTYGRLPPSLQAQLRSSYQPKVEGDFLATGVVHEGDARDLLPRIKPASVALSIWSPPYFVGKSYERDLQFSDWEALLEEVIRLHWPVISPGGFLVINIADILCFRDPAMPRVQAVTNRRSRADVSREQVLEAMRSNPGLNRYQIAKKLGCSEQTVDRRIHGNNIRGGKHQAQTRTRLVGGSIEKWALAAGFYTYDRRIWVKDPAWENSRWSSLSYRAIDEFEYLYIFWKPGITEVDRSRLAASEWRDWGSRGVWYIPSVRANDDHEAKFPLELPRRAIRLLTSPGDVVLDCFLGSGTTAVAAALESRGFIGIEKDRRSCTLARSNIDRAKVQPSLYSSVSG